MTYNELCESILMAQEEMLKYGIEANSVTLNGRKYGKLIENCPPNMKPTIFGMAVKADYALPDAYDFLVQHEPPQPHTNADRIRAMTDEELADFLCYWDNCSSTEGLGYNTERVGDHWLCSAPGGGDIVGECQACAMAWLKSPVEVDND